MENVKYILFVWNEDLENDPFISFLADTIKRNNGIICPFVNEDLARSQKWFARADYKEKYPNAKIIDVM